VVLRSLREAVAGGAADKHMSEARHPFSFSGRFAVCPLTAAPKYADNLDVTVAGSQASRWDAVESRSLRETVVAGGGCTK
jgi:hypothetical protein